VLEQIQKELEDYQLAVRVSKEDFNEWHQNKVTRRFLNDIRIIQLDALEYISNKQREDYPEKVGLIKALNIVLNYKPSEIDDDNAEDST